jgi:L-ascorbate metabolism protein UlaG (beta-lactamase superfamily)
VGFLRSAADFSHGPIKPAPVHPDPKNWPDRGLHAAWLGQTTILLKVDGTTILTDPVFSDRVGISLGPLTLGIRRLVKPAVRLCELPHIDLVLISHAHMDHMDLPSLRKLEDKNTVVVMASNTSDLIRAGRYQTVQELDWGQRVQAGPIQIRAFEVNHWGARLRRDTYRGYNGYTIETGRYRIVFAGDTAATTAFRKLRTSRPYDLAIMPVGAYYPWHAVHCNPEEAWRMGNDASSEFFIPVHHQTFQLSREPLLEPIERLYAVAGRHSDRIAISKIGQEFRI